MWFLRVMKGSIVEDKVGVLMWWWVQNIKDLVDHHRAICILCRVRWKAIIAASEYLIFLTSKALFLHSFTVLFKISILSIPLSDHLLPVCSVLFENPQFNYLWPPLDLLSIGCRIFHYLLPSPCPLFCFSFTSKISSTFYFTIFCT